MAEAMPFEKEEEFDQRVHGVFSIFFLPGSFYLESTERAGFGGVELVLDDGIDAAAAGAFAELGAEVVDVLGLTGGDNFDIAGIGVPHPAAQAELGGFAVNKPAEADALHTAANEKVHHHAEKPVSQRVRSESRQA